MHLVCAWCGDAVLNTWNRVRRETSMSHGRNGKEGEGEAREPREWQQRWMCEMLSNAQFYAPTDANLLFEVNKLLHVPEDRRLSHLETLSIVSTCPVR